MFWRDEFNRDDFPSDLTLPNPFVEVGTWKDDQTPFLKLYYFLFFY